MAGDGGGGGGGGDSSFAGSSDSGAKGSSGAPAGGYADKGGGGDGGGGATLFDAGGAGVGGSAGGLPVGSGGDASVGGGGGALGGGIDLGESVSHDIGAGDGSGGGGGGVAAGSGDWMSNISQGSGIGGSVAPAGGVSASADGITPLQAPIGSAAGPGAGAIASAAGPSASSGNSADATSSWGDMFKIKNPAQTALGAAGLGWNIYQGQQTSANQQAMINLASQQMAQNKALQDKGVLQSDKNVANADALSAEGKGLREYLATGQLPAQYTSQIDQAINDAKQTAISNAAKNGQPTDPTKNTALAQSLAQIDNQRAGMTSQIAERLFGSGLSLAQIGTGANQQTATSLLGAGQSAAGLSGQLYSTLTNLDQKQSEATAKAIAALAQSLNNGSTKAAA